MLDWISSHVTLVFYLFLIYGVIVASWVILENRTPQSTFAWLFLLLLFPVGGIFLYHFFGRGWRTFSKETLLARQALMGEEPEAVAQYLRREQMLVQQIAQRQPATYKRKLLHLVTKNASSVLTAHNEVVVLQDAQEKYPRLIADIKAATHSIHMAYYIWEEDPFTESLKTLLIQKAQAGVEVRILCDAYGLNVSRRYLNEMRSGGAQMYVYYNYLSPLRLHTVSYRNHRKIAVIDGTVGYVGGLNISQEHLDGGKHFAHWRDTHLRIEGEAVAALQAIFLTSWYNTTDERLSTDIYTKAPYQTWLDQRHTRVHALSEPLPAHAVADMIERYLPIHITVSGPDSQWQAIRQLYFMMILSAEDHLYIQSPFFIPDESILEALKAAALSGVDVRLMCASSGTTYSLPYWAANTYFADMAEAGVRIFLYQNGYFHSKTINVDSVLCSVGTANLDIRSFSINYEVNAVIYDEATARKLTADFLDDQAECIEFVLQEYKSRSFLVRVRDSIARLFSPLL
ncbi:MAG: cardiolipin synthase [Caldilineaceae bacterium]|nr:cardiolipin synthase [Caldilineaceae bacterium]